MCKDKSELIQMMCIEHSHMGEPCMSYAHGFA